VICSSRLFNAISDSFKSSSRILCPGVSAAPGFSSIFNTVDATGLVITCSNSGTTVPDPLIVASISPVSTIAVLIRLIDMDDSRTLKIMKKKAITKANTADALTVFLII
jgi:hypothetical protein